ncbi:acyl-CoA dehydrogenase family protein [Sphingomonas bacterium]|uniref:acyl-CoA dehydrogenase family protein n=1 Tax=Sphingomonas bacterium TaxID=1895847 RepID=UPI001574F62B|nr:acyl-CoA dehydrogenase family protein [Sphingomonas bacterium]
MALGRSPWIDDELAMLQEHVARFIEAEFTPHVPRWRKDRMMDRAAWLKAGEAGLLCASIPEIYGGGGGSYAHEAVIHQEMTRAGHGTGFGVGNSTSSAVVAHYILAYGTEDQKQRWLPKMAQGELIGAIAMTEPQGGSDLKALRTTARRVAGGYQINGQKTFISNGQNANLVTVVARTGDEPGARGLSLIVVETDQADGFRRGRNLDKLGMHTQDTSELFFDDVFAPSSNLIGELPGQAFSQLMHELAWERMLVSLDATVNMERAVELTVDYVRTRNIFGKTLMDFQNTQFVLADAKTQATVARTFVDGMMVRLLAGELDGPTAAMAKLWTTETQCRVIDACQQLFGGYGYMSEYPIAQLFADARVSRVYGGASEIMKVIIARAL